MDELLTKSKTLDKILLAVDYIILTCVLHSCSGIIENNYVITDYVCLCVLCVYAGVHKKNEEVKFHFSECSLYTMVMKWHF